MFLFLLTDYHRFYFCKALATIRIRGILCYNYDTDFQFVGIGMSDRLMIVATHTKEQIDHQVKSCTNIV